jgi:hypothetical protein
MSAISDLITLDYEDGGLPFFVYPKTDTLGLDIENGGLPFVAQAAALQAGDNIIYVSAPAARARTLNRDFPNVREEQISWMFSQLKGHNPAYQVQDPSLIP